ncbi:MAG: aldo/keto reductase [Saprospiraceae bacterium]|nr:aldo/keto reductase [Saprospiraceae bacterium]
MRNNKAYLSLGTAAIGRPQYINIREKKARSDLSLEEFRKRGLALIQQAYEAGIRYFDTAPGYGLAEDLLIQWLKTLDNPNLEVATKWGYTYTANFDPNATQHEVKEHSLNKLNEQWQRSKALLPYLSTYQIHSATFDTGVLENVAVLTRLAELKEEYGLRIGLSSTGSNQLEVVQRSLDVEVNGIPLFDAFQVTYNVLDQSLAPLLKALAKEGKRVIIKEALANGRVFPNSEYAHYQELYQRLTYLAQQHEVGIDAIALQFCRQTVQPLRQYPKKRVIKK